MKELKQNTFEHKGTKNSYYTTGSGPSVMLVHGFAEEHTIWRKLIPELQDYRLILPDLPGYGSSEFNENFSSMSDYAVVLKGILDEEEINNCIMIGHSMGGYISLAFAEKYPGSLTGFGLFHSSAYADDEEKKKKRDKGIEFIRANGSLPFLKTMVPDLFYDGEVSIDLIDAQIRGSENLSPACLIQNYEAMKSRKDRTGVLKEFGKPILFIAGEHDNAVPYKSVLEQSHLPSVSYIYTLKHSGHMGMLEEPEKAIHILQEFCRFSLSAKK